MVRIHNLTHISLLLNCVLWIVGSLKVWYLLVAGATDVLNTYISMDRANIRYVVVVGGWGCGLI